MENKPLLIQFEDLNHVVVIVNTATIYLDSATTTEGITNYWVNTYLNSRDGIISWGVTEDTFNRIVEYLHPVKL